MLKIDLHTHSSASPDGGISLPQYQSILQTGVLNYVAITDHNRIDFATHAFRELGDQIIVGEEILTREGEIIGLFLNELVPAGLSAQETVAAIKAQNGLVYIPHPFETVRNGIHPATLESIQSQVDIIEVCNGRVFLQDRGKQALVWSKLNRVAGAASSDAHSVSGLGRTYSTISNQPTAQNLASQLASGSMYTKRPTLRSLLAPKYHRTRKKLVGKS